MPFTPFHLGPGLAIKALGGHRISLLVFAGTQVLMDIEPLLGLLGLIDSLHGVSHSLAGALLMRRLGRANPWFMGALLVTMVLTLSTRSR